MKLCKALLLTALTLVSAKKLKYLGVNEAGGDFGEGHLPGVYNTHYTYPNINAINTSIEQGMNAFRMGLRWERFQHELFGELTEFDLTEYKKIVDATTAKGAVIIVDPHNYARYNNKLIGSEDVPVEAFVDFWKKMANVFKDNENVWFGLVNEPHDMETDDWFKIARAAVDGIRSTGANNTILIPGNGWDGAWSWGSQAWYGESNAEVALRYFSSEDKNIAFEVHQYFNSDFSGGSGTCEKRPCQNNVKEFVQWLKDNNLKGWFGEFSGHITDSQCKGCVQEFLEYIQENNEYVLGATWWAAGPWWGQNNYTIEPNDKKEFPEQMAWLKPYLPGPSELTEVPIYSNKKTYCKGCVVTGTGGDGSLWGWENSKACRIDVETCNLSNDPEPEKPVEEPASESKYCKGCVVTGTGGDGSLWGWENKKACRIDVEACKSDEVYDSHGAKLEYVGVNEAGGDFGEGHLPGVYNTHYTYPNIDAISASIEQGMNAFRMGLRWERFQHELFGELNEFDITEYKKVVDAATAQGAVIIIDPHNYARYNDKLIGSEEVPVEAFIDFWTKVAEVFKDNEKVWFGLVNEPHTMETDDWFKIARATVDAIRAIGSNNTILVPGNGWTGGWSWGSQAWYGESNAEAALRYFSSDDENIIFEVHQYFDSDSAGGTEVCVKRPCQNNVKEFVQWLKDNGLKGWIGEIGGGVNDECKACIQELFEYLQVNRDVIKGVTWWAAGPWWGQYMFSLEPNAKKEFPEQMAWLKPYLPGPSKYDEVPIFVNKKTYCKGCVVTGTGDDGSLWGWENSKACRIDVETCNLSNDPEPEKPVEEPAAESKYCKGCVVTGTGGDGSLWGWENKKACRIDVETCNKADETPAGQSSGGKLKYLGVNEAGGDFGEGHLPGVYNTHYTYPNINAINTSIEQGMNAFRMGLRWERFQHELFGELTEFDLTEYKKIVDATTAKGAVIIVDPHNYARYNNKLIGSEDVPVEAFVDFWKKMANVFKDNENVWFGLVNEPHDMETDDWFKIARAAVDGIRSTGANNTILIPGNGWDGAWSWGSQAWYGESNAEVALRYFSSEDKNIAFEVHQYFNSDFSGGSGTCEKRPCQNNVKEFVQWLKDNNLKGWFGEFSGHVTDSQCKGCVQEFLEYIQLNNEYVLGATWWAAGPWWGQNNYTIEPNDKKEFPEQMAWLKPYLPGPSELTEVPIYSNKKTYCEGCVVTGTGGDGSLWGWENSKACRIDVETCKIGQNTPEPTSEPTPENGCKAEALGYKCCSTCISILEDEDGLWGAENGEWCGIADKCTQEYNECWSTQFGYPCCDTCDVFLSDEDGEWGVKDLDWCGIPSTCKA